MNVSSIHKLAERSSLIPFWYWMLPKALYVSRTDIMSAKAVGALRRLALAPASSMAAASPALPSARLDPSSD